MKDLREKLSTFIFRNKIILLLAAALIWLAAFAASFSMHLEEDLFKLLPGNDRNIREAKQLMEAFRLMDTVFVVLSGKMPEDKLILAGDSLYLDMKDSGFFEKISYEWAAEDIFPVLDICRESRASLFDDDFRRRTEEALSSEEIDKRLKVWKKILAEAPAPFIGMIFVADPLGLDFQFLEKLKKFKGFGKDLKIKSGRLFSEDGKSLLLMASGNVSAGDINASEKFTKFMEGAFAKLRKSNPGIEINSLYGQRFSVENAEKMKRGTAFSICIATLAIICLSLLVYRRILLVPLTLLPALFGTTVALGFCAVFYKGVSAISIGCGSMLIGITVDYGIYLLFQYDRQDAPEENALKKLHAEISVPLAASAATTAAAFAVLFLSVMPGYRELGIFALTGVISAALFAIFILPLLIQSKTLFTRKEPLLNLAKIYPVLTNFTLCRRKEIIVCAIILSAAMIPGLMMLKFDGNMEKMNAVSDKINAEKEFVLNTFGDPGAAIAVGLHAASYGELMKNNEALTERLRQLKNAGMVKSFISLSELLPSPENAARNAVCWKEFWTDKKVMAFAKDLKTAAIRNGMKPEVFIKFLKSLGKTEGQSQLLTPERFEATMLEVLFANLTAKKNGEYYLINRVELQNEKSFDKFAGDLRENIPGAMIYQSSALSAGIMKLIYGEFRKTGVISFCAVFIILLIYYRNLKDTIPALMPLFGSLLWTFGIMGYCGMRINMMNCIISIFVFGLVIDYCIFISSALRKNDDSIFRSRTFGAVTCSALTVIFGFGALCAAGHPALVSLGVSSVLGVGLGFAGALLLIPALVNKSEEGIAKL